MREGYVIVVKDYNAEIVRFVTMKEIIMPDSSKLYYVHTKYGNEYFKESDLFETEEELVVECKQLNDAMKRINR
jgi:hypothetical protein